MRLRIECTKIVLISVLMSSFYGFFASLRLGFFAFVDKQFQKNRITSKTKIDFKNKLINEIS